MPELMITLPDGRTLRHPLDANPAIIGRDHSCEIPIDDPSASRQHAKFSAAPNGFFVEDLGSKNGTLINDMLVSHKLLAHGDRMQIGSTLVVFNEKEGTMSAASVMIADEPSSSHATRYISKDQQLLLSQRRLQMIYELTERLTTLQSQTSLFETAMDICFDTLNFERGAIGVRRQDAQTLDWPVVRNLQDIDGGLTISRTLLTRALEHGERAIFTDDGTGGDPTVSMVQQGIRSAMCVPLLHNDKILGIIYGDRTSTATPYANEDIDFFAGIAQQVTVGLINSRLMEQQEENARREQEIDAARRIQTGLFPKTLPCEPPLIAAALNDPGQRVSGDYYDVIRCGAEEKAPWWLLIADVTGEGVAAAILMANLQAAVHVKIRETNDLSLMMTQWNDLIVSNTDSSTFITCLLALADPEAGTIRLCSAGHHSPILLRPDASEPEEPEIETGFPLGVVADTTYESTLLEVGSDPVTMFCYTDGVIEAMDPDSGQYGKERLFTELQENRTAPPDTLIKRVRKDMTRFVSGARQSDDITMLAARIG